MADVTIDTEEKRLRDHPERSAPLPPWVGVAFGVALTAFAALAEAALLAVVLLGPAKGLGPIMLVVPPVVMILGIALGVQGWRAVRRQTDWRARAALRPGEPWHADWTWDPAGIAAETEGGGSGADRSGWSGSRFSSVSIVTSAIGCVAAILPGAAADVSLAS